MTRAERLPGHPGHAYDLLSDGSNQGERDLRVGHTMGLLESLLVDERHACPDEPVGC